MKRSGFGGKMLFVENFLEFCYKLSMPVPPGSASPG